MPGYAFPSLMHSCCLPFGWWRLVRWCVDFAVAAQMDNGLVCPDLCLDRVFVQVQLRRRVLFDDENLFPAVWLSLSYVVVQDMLPFCAKAAALVCAVRAWSSLQISVLFLLVQGKQSMEPFVSVGDPWFAGTDCGDWCGHGVIIIGQVGGGCSNPYGPVHRPDASVASFIVAPFETVGFFDAWCREPSQVRISKMLPTLTWYW